MDSFIKALAILLECQPEQASILAEVQAKHHQLAKLEVDLKRSQDALEQLAEAVYRAHILEEKPNEVQIALDHARQVLGV